MNELQKMEVEFSRQETVRARAYAGNPTEGRGYVGNLLCNKCKLHHTGTCKVRCRSCQKVGHQSKDCRGKAPATTSKTAVTCFGCGEMGHYKNKCHKKKGQQVTEVNEENKRQDVICSFFANGWCIRGNSYHMSVSDQQKETSVAAYQRSEAQNDEGLANSAAAPSITCSSEVKPELQKENIVTIPSVNDAGTKGLQEKPPANTDSSLHDASSNPINGSDTLKNSWVSSYTATMEEPGGKGNQFGFHNNKMPTTSYSINHNSSSFQPTKIMPPSNHSSVWPMASTSFSSSTLKHLGSQSEHSYSTKEVLLNPVTKLSTFEWAPSKPFRSAFLISQGIYTPDILYDPIRDSIESPNIEDKLSKFPPSSRLPSISGTYSPKNVNPLKIETIRMTNGSDRSSLASH
nr:protein FRIGIDA-ESSENTIAL 1-like isoform X1 [Tanacetum cinerariifolium]